MKSILLATLALLIVSGSGASERPNIIFILADDMGWSDVGCFQRVTSGVTNTTNAGGEGR